MSTVTTPTKAPRIVATLIRGETFSLRDQVFKRGKPQAIDAATRAYLEKVAVDVRHYPELTGEDGEGEIRRYPRFEFKTE